MEGLEDGVLRETHVLHESALCTALLTVLLLVYNLQTYPFFVATEKGTTQKKEFLHVFLPGTTKAQSVSND